MVEQTDFAQVVLPHLDEAYSLARWLTGSAADAEDVVQESLMKALKHFAGFRGPAARPWLLTIVRRTCFTWLAANRPRQLVFTDDDAAIEALNRTTVVTLHPKAAETPESLLADKQAAEELNAAVEALPAPFREVVVLREIHDLSYKEIAAIAEIPVGTVMSRLARARSLLLARLDGSSPREVAHGR
ncbi:MAG: sigma-70 family RNA polymerase sigma factor [Dongiales bacterium]